MTTSKTKPGRYAHTIHWIILLSIFWLLLSGFLKPLLLSFGAISVAVVVFISNRMDTIDKEQRQFGSLLKIARYTPWLVIQIISSSLRVTKLVWGSPSKISPTLAKINIENVPQAQRTLYANSITLTPGTLSVDLVGDELTVHALEKSSVDELNEGYIASKIIDIWGLDK